MEVRRSSAKVLRTGFWMTHVQILHDVKFEGSRKSRSLDFLGANGAGKTTLDQSHCWV